MKPIVSIILTSYNKPNTVGEAIESVMNQSFKEWELFIMDDASNDETIKRIESYVQDERIHFINSHVQDSNRYRTTRYATLINNAIPKTSGKYLTYLTDDTIYLPTRVETMVHHLETNPTIDVVYSGQQVIHVDEKFQIIDEETRMSKEKLKSAANIVDHCSVMHTRRIAEKVKQVFGDYWDDNPKYWHNGDAAFWTRLNEFALFYPINEILDISYKTPYSFQNLNAYLPENIPEGTLVKGNLSDIYLIENNMRRQIKEDLLDRLNYQASKIIEIPAPNLFKYSIGPDIDNTAFFNPSLFPNGRLVTTFNGGEVYYIQNHKKRLIVTQNAFKKFKFKTLGIIEINKDFLEQFEEGPSIEDCLTKETILPDQILFQETNSFYLSYNNHLHFIDQKIFEKLKISKQQAVQITKEERLLFPEGNPFNWSYFKIGRKQKKRRYSRKSVFVNKKR